MKCEGERVRVDRGVNSSGLFTLILQLLLAHRIFFFPAGEMLTSYASGLLGISGVAGTGECRLQTPSSDASSVLREHNRLAYLLRAIAQVH